MESNLLTKKERKRRTTSNASISQGIVGYKRHKKFQEGLDDEQESVSDVTSNSNISNAKRRKINAETQERREKADHIRKLQHEFKVSKHIHQLEHMADVCEDYNYIVDRLEDEHERRVLHFTVSALGAKKQ